MKEYFIGIGTGVGLVLAWLYILQNRKRVETDVVRKSRKPANGNPVRDRQDRIELLEKQFFLGMDKKMKLSQQQIDDLKRYLRNAVSEHPERFDNAQDLRDILRVMTQINIIGPGRYGCITRVLHNARINPDQIAVNITRLTDAVADVRDGVRQRDYGSDIFEYDGIIIHCDDDRDDVMKFIDNMTVLLDVPDLSLCSVNEYKIAKSKLTGMSTIYIDTRCVYVYVTQNLTQDKFNRFMAEMALIDSLSDPEKKDRIVPIWTCKERISIPELLPFPGVKYWWYSNSDRDKEHLRKKFRKHVIDVRYEIQQSTDTCAS